MSLPTDSVVLCRTHAFGSAHGPRAARFVDLEQAHGTLSFGEPAPGCSTCRRRWEGREGGLGRNKIKCKESVRGQLGQRLARSYSIVARSSVYAIRHGRLVVITVIKKTSGLMVLCLAAREVRHGHTRSFRNGRVLPPCLGASIFKNLDFENLVGSSSFCPVSCASFR